MFLLFIPRLICISLPSPCGTSEQHEVKASHLLTSVTSWTPRDLQPYLRWSSAVSVCRPITGSRSSEPSTRESLLCYFLYFVISRAFNAAQTQILPCQNTNTSWGLNENVVAECDRQQQTLPHFFPWRRFPLLPLASLRHNVWQTHRFVALKTPFQRVTINNSLMTNSADIYTWLGVFLRRAGGQ